jgi:signal transduction histidine kinase
MGMGTVAGTLKEGWAALRAFVARRASLVVGVVAVLALVSLGAWRWSSLKSAAALQWEQRVSGLADAKKLAIESWLLERRQAAAIVAEYARPGIAAQGRQWSAVQQLAGFRRLWVADPQGRVTASAGASDEMGSRLGALVRLTSRDGRARIEGPLRTAAGLAIAIASPVVAPAATGDSVPRALGAVLVTVDPADVLYPLLSHQPFANATGQCYVVGREGNHVVLLSARQHPAAEPLSERMPFATAPMLDRLAADGLRTFGAFASNEGIPVIAAVRRIGASDWGLVCRMDRWEASAPLLARARGEALAALSMLLAIALVVQRFQRQHLRAMEEETRRTAERVASVEGHRRSLEHQLQQAQKMEAVGQLAGGMAHDFNNLLTSILAASELAREDLPPGSPAASELDAIDHAGKRGAELTRKLLAFGRRQRLEFRLVDLTWVVRDFSAVIRRVVRENIELRNDLPDAAVVVRADQGALEQVLLNLATNARDAMPEGGTLRIGVGRQTLDEVQARAAGLSAAGTYAALTVSDSGKGMDAVTLSRAFEPFYSTKPVGMATGLGLAMVYGVCRQHKGHVTVESTLGAGTTFTVLLPLVSGTPAVPLPEEAAAAPGGGERILLVEDEEGLLTIGRRVLERHGYRVLTASDGQAALALLRAEREPIDLLVTDVVMPRMGGPQLYEALCRERRAPRVLFTSGYAARDIRDTGALDPDLPFLNKPWTISSLLGKVREVLDAPVPEVSAAPPA